MSETPPLEYTGSGSERWWRMRVRSTSPAEGRTRQFIFEWCSWRTWRRWKPIFPSGTRGGYNPSCIEERRTRKMIGHVDSPVRSGRVENIVGTRWTIGICKHPICVKINDLPPCTHFCIAYQSIFAKSFVSGYDSMPDKFSTRTLALLARGTGN